MAKAIKVYTNAGGDGERIVFGNNFVIAETKKGTVIQTSGVAYTVEEPFDEVVADLEGRAVPAKEPAATEEGDGSGGEGDAGTGV